MAGGRVVVLGAGRVGRAIAWDLAGDWDVCAVDVDQQSLGWLAERRIATARADVRDSQALAKVVQQAHWVVNAVPGFLGFSVLRTLVELGCSVVDISFMPEDPRVLHELARQRGVQVAVDCGVAPGFSHLVLGYWFAQAERLDSFFCYVGGLPKERLLPWEYKAPFSPVDVLEEYTRPARLRRQGQVITLPALSEPELRYVPGVGTLEAFLTDGLRTALHTLPVPTMVEKTLRYPGYRDKILLLRESGLLRREPVVVDRVQVAPLAVTALALAEAWRLAEGEGDVTVMELEAQGVFDGHLRTRHLFLYDQWDPTTGLSSMGRTTGFTATAILRALGKGMVREVGVLLPEVLGQNLALTRFVASYLGQRGIQLSGEGL
ncbi:MAG: saccharopine dehydrogenase NADP-binding domain-containing protein [Thermoanaerobaculum sp.]|nr:saccharopine dehydrogenase NADP-binding domain-containing protein [Thermoanaerobaculum sp.]